MALIKFTWTSTGSSGAVSPPAKIHWPPMESAMYGIFSTINATNSYRVETAQESTGPWFSEGSTSVAINASTGVTTVIRFTGPYVYVQPYLQSASTGTITFTLVGV